MTDRIRIELISMTPFTDRNPAVTAGIRRILSVLESRPGRYLDCQSVWAEPALPYPYPVKYNEDAMNLIDEKVASGETRLYAVHDADLAAKGQRWKQAYVNIRVCVRHLPVNCADLGYGVSMTFSREVGEILLENGLAEMTEDLARVIRADYGWIDCDGYTQTNIYTDLTCLGDQAEVPSGYDLTGRIPSLSWWTLLSRQHLERLGGREAVSVQAPCHAVRDISGDGYEALALQMTEGPFGEKDSVYPALRRYLLPVIPPVNRYALALRIRSGKIPEARLRMNTTEQEYADAQVLKDIDPRELCRKAAVHSPSA